MTIRAATPDDAAAVHALLRAADLPLAGLPDDLRDFLVAEEAGALIGAIGRETYDDTALLRSAVVAPAARGAGHGEALVQALIADARDAGLRQLVLLTTTAEDWFPRFGFARITRADLPAAVHASEELRGACPDTAVVMRLLLG